MDSQQIASNAAETPSDRALNAVKSNPPLPSGFRARPQGPPGLPRHSINNGPIGQPRLGGHPQQIRFENRPPIGPNGAGQFVQLRPYGSPRPPGGSFPQRLPHQGQNPPVLLNPRFPASSVPRAGPQQGPRPPHPGNYYAQQAQGHFYRPPPDNPHAPGQQARKPEILVRPPRIAQRPLQRNESSLNVPAENFAARKDERRLTTPRIVIDKMADVDSAAQLRRLENAATKEKAEPRENAENDDDDDVVMDGKSPRPNGEAPGQQILVDRPSAAMMNGKVGDKMDGKVGDKMDGKVSNKMDGKVSNKMDDKVGDKVGDKIDGKVSNKMDDKVGDKMDGKMDSKMDEKVGKISSDSGDKTSSIKPDDDLRKQVADKVDSKSEESDRNRVERDQTTTNAKESSNVEAAKVSVSNNLSNPAVTATDSKDVISKSDKVEQSSHPAEVANSRPAEDKSSASSPSTAEASRAASRESKPNEDEIGEGQASKSPGKTSDKSRDDSAVTPSQIPKDRPEPTAPSKPADNAMDLERESEALKSPERKQDVKHEDLDKAKPPSATPSDAASCPLPEVDKSVHETEQKTPSKPSDNSTVATSVKTEEHLGKKGSEVTSKSKDPPRDNIESAKLDQKKTEDKAKVDSKQINVPRADTDTKEDPKATQESEEKRVPSATAVEKKSETVVDSSKQPPETESGPESRPQTEKSVAVEEVKKSQTTVEEMSETVEKTSEEANRGRSAEVTNVMEEVSKSLDKVSKSADEVDHAAPPAEESSVAAADQKTCKLERPPSLVDDQAKGKESTLAPPTSPEDSVKGFDNGQQRPVKSPARHPSRSPVSPKSSKSPIDEEIEKPFHQESSNERTIDDGEEASETKTVSKPSTPDVLRTPTPASSEEKSEQKPPRSPEIQNGSVTNESIQSSAQPTTNGVADSPTKKSPTKAKESHKRSTAGSPVKSPSKSVKSLPRTPDTPTSTASQEKKKVPMNKVQVGAAPSPNLKTVRSKIGSLDNASYKPGGGNVKIEIRKLDFSKAQPKIAAKNEKYTPSGGDKKIAQVKLQWNAKPKVGSLENATYKPGGGDKKIETVKLDFKNKAKPKVGSKDNVKHVPGGGSVKSSATPPKSPQETSNDIQTQKIDIKAESKVGSLDNVEHKPGGGDKKIFNDTDYLRQAGSNVESLSDSGSEVRSARETNSSVQQTKDDSPQPPPTTPTKARSIPSPSSLVTPKAVRSSLAKSPEKVSETVEIQNKKNSPPANRGATKEKAAKSVTSPSNPVNSESKNPEGKSAKSPNSSSPPNNPRLKSPNKSPSDVSGKLLAKELRLPKLTPSSTPQESITVSDNSASISFPKLIEHVSH